MIFFHTYMSNNKSVMPLIILPAIVISSIFFSKKNYDAYYTPYIMRFLNILFLWKKIAYYFQKYISIKKFFINFAFRIWKNQVQAKI